MRNFLSWGMLMVVLLAAGCAEEPPYVPSVNTISNAESSAKIKLVADRRVETDAFLSRQLGLTEIRESTTNDGYKRVQIFMKNMSGTTYAVLYRFNWYDNNGVEVENTDDEMWKRKTIAAGDDVTLTTVAPKQTCGDFKLRLKVVE